MKANFYWVEPLTNREITEGEFNYSIKMMEAYGLDPIEFIEIAHTIIDGELVIEVYLKITSDKLYDCVTYYRSQE